MSESAALASWNEIEYSCSQILNECDADRVPDLFSADFMHEYTTFPSYDAMLSMLHTSSANVREVSDIVGLDTPACDECIAEHTEFANWHDLVTTACSYFLASNLA